MLEDIEYKLESVQATSVASEKIDETFRSTCIGTCAYTSLYCMREGASTKSTNISHQISSRAL